MQQRKLQVQGCSHYSPPTTIYIYELNS